VLYTVAEFLFCKASFENTKYIQRLHLQNTMPCTGHDHDHEDEDQLGLSLQSYIQMDQVYALNEFIPNSGKLVLKPYSDRLSLSPSLLSQQDEDDVELLIHIPFTEAVSIRSISISGRTSVFIPDEKNGGLATSAPYTAKVFVNRTDLDFDLARELPPDAKIELLPPEHVSEVQTPTNDSHKGGTLDYPLRPAVKFKYCNCITIFFGDNYAQKISESQGHVDDLDAMPTEITYIGFKGAGTGTKRVAVECIYETKGMKKDHKVPDGEFGAKESKMQ
jgi:hypothetical protein